MMLLLFTIVLVILTIGYIAYYPDPPLQPTPGCIFILYLMNAQNEIVDIVGCYDNKYDAFHYAELFLDKLKCSHLFVRINPIQPNSILYNGIRNEAISFRVIAKNGNNQRISPVTF